MELSVREIARLVDGEIVGRDDIVVKGLAALDRAGDDEISFAVSEKYRTQIQRTRACAVIVPADMEEPTKTLIRVENPYLAMAKVSTVFNAAPAAAIGVSPRACVSERVSLGKDISIHPGVFVDDHVVLGDRVTLYPGVVVGPGVTIGDDVVVHPNVSILKGCKIGNRVIIHAGSVIGSDGFGFAFDGDRYHKIPQTGIVRIDDDVEVGACNTIDRATFGETWIQRGVKTDNLVHIAHNVVVGENSVLVAQVGVSGSVTIGRNCVLAGQAGIAQHLTIGDRVTVGPQAGIAKSIPDGEIISGSPGMPHRLWLKTSGLLTKLPEMKKRIKDLEKRIMALEAVLERKEK
ncbi:MAG: UDP-3-O-(3-hydroxymyristoyl)glucosamine N-acyltransferase [Deltaproteobacteria bacterium]|nr:UDP-3-O-(3-hydroxymyristoyl)glucosamine N-acyltransferase [Deltaproteobacteria bacterium]